MWTRVGATGEGCRLVGGARGRGAGGGHGRWTGVRRRWRQRRPGPNHHSWDAQSDWVGLLVYVANPQTFLLANDLNLFF